MRKSFERYVLTFFLTFLLLPAEGKNASISPTSEAPSTLLEFPEYVFQDATRQRPLGFSQKYPPSIKPPAYILATEEIKKTKDLQKLSEDNKWRLVQILELCLELIENCTFAKNLRG